MEKSDLRIVFFGTSDFGCPTLDTLLLNGYNVVGVVTKPDFNNLRKKRIEQTPIKEKAISLGIPVLEVNDMDSKDFHAKLGAFSGNVFIVIAFQMIPMSVYSMAKYGTFNMHASLLPDYRGAAPINWAIANGEERIGMTSFFINDKIDDGDIILQSSIPNYSNRNFTEIYNILSNAICPGLCCLTLTEIIKNDGNVPRHKQNLEGNKLHKAPKLNHDNTKLDLAKDIKNIFNHIKAFSEKPGAWIKIRSTDKYNDKEIKIISGELISFGSRNTIGNGNYFSIVNDDLLLFASDGCIKVNKLQLEGCKAMQPKDFINGYGNILENWELI